MISPKAQLFCKLFLKHAVLYVLTCSFAGLIWLFYTDVPNILKQSTTPLAVLSQLPFVVLLFTIAAFLPYLGSVVSVKLVFESRSFILYLIAGVFCATWQAWGDDAVDLQSIKLSFAIGFISACFYYVMDTKILIIKRN